MDNLTALLLNNYINGGGGSGGGLPSGGTDGQIIRKDTSAQEGAVWQNVDAAPTENSTNLVESGGVAAAREEAAREATDFERLEAQTLYTALMTGTLLEG